jgi:hypothetical protein
VTIDAAAMAPAVRAAALTDLNGLYFASRRARSSVAERPNIEISVVPFYGTHRLRMPGHSVTVTAWIEVAR